MKFRNYIFYFVIGVSTLVFGLAWVGVFNLFFGNSFITLNHSCPADNSVKVTEVEQTEEIKFDINDPESVLPIDYKEDKLTSPKVDEDNPEYFDPEGKYFLLDETAEDFKDVSYLKIENKNFDVSQKDPRFGESIAPKGSVVIDDKKQIELEKIKIADGKIKTESKEKDGIKYEFDGEFVVKGNFYTLDENAQVLKGTLIKKRNGEVIAKGDVSFGWTLE